MLRINIDKDKASVKIQGEPKTMQLPKHESCRPSVMESQPVLPLIAPYRFQGEKYNAQRNGSFCTVLIFAINKFSKKKQIF
jgi:hypothetical protein